MFTLFGKFSLNSKTPTYPYEPCDLIYGSWVGKDACMSRLNGVATVVATYA